jgi:regulator of sirC expression with transglutaminase-like and TPR domain
MSARGEGLSVNATALEPALRFSAFAALPDDRLRLDEGVLLVAEIAYPDLIHARVLRRLDVLAAEVRAELGMAAGSTLPADSLGQREIAARTLAALRDVLAGREGFHGNQDDYYEPRNSFLPDVLDRRTGLPIALSVVYIEVARRLGAPLVGVGLPAHFVAKWPLPSAEGGDLFVDAFSGVVLDQGECRRLVVRALVTNSVPPAVDSRWFAPTGTRAIITRMLNNLKQVYLQTGDTTRALAVVDRLVQLRPDLPEELRDRGLLRLALGEVLLAAADLVAYGERAPQAPELRRLRKRLAAIGEVRAKLN